MELIEKIRSELNDDTHDNMSPPSSPPASPLGSPIKTLGISPHKTQSVSPRKTQSVSPHRTQSTISFGQASNNTSVMNDDHISSPSKSKFSKLFKHQTSNDNDILKSKSHSDHEPKSKTNMLSEFENPIIVNVSNEKKIFDDHMQKLIYTKSIENIVMHIVKHIFLLDSITPQVDTWINILKDNLIMNYLILSRLDPTDIDLIDLPISLKRELKNIINDHRQGNHFLCFEPEIINKINNFLTPILDNIMQHRHSLSESNCKQIMDKLYHSYIMTNIILLINCSMDFIIDRFIMFLLTFTKSLTSNIHEITDRMINEIAILHILFDMKYDNKLDYDLFGYVIIMTLKDSYEDIFDSETTLVFYNRINKLVDKITDKINVVNNGICYKVHYRDNKKWIKMNMLILINKIALSDYSDDTYTDNIEIANIDRIEHKKYKNNYLGTQVCHWFKIIMTNGKSKQFCLDNVDDLETVLNELTQRVNICKNHS